MDAQRIAIWGNSGSGKSTLAEHLACELVRPLYHIDKIAWQRGWKYTDEATFLDRHQCWIDEPSWIIEGVGHMSGLKRRFARADLIVFLDTPVEVCRVRAQHRIEEDRTSQNRFISEGCRYSEVVEKQFEVIDYFERHLRGEIAVMVAQEFGAARHIRVDGRKPTTELSVEVRRA